MYKRQGYEGFAVGAGNMSREQALTYLDESMRQIAKLCGYNAFMPGNKLLVPFSNAADIGKAFSNAWKVFDGKERPWEMCIRDRWSAGSPGKAPP